MLLSGFTKCGFKMCCPLLPPLVAVVDGPDGHWKLLGDAFKRDAAGMNSGDCGVTKYVASLLSDGTPFDGVKKIWSMAEKLSGGRNR